MVGSRDRIRVSPRFDQILTDPFIASPAMHGEQFVDQQLPPSCDPIEGE
jgi:hypothetical protein